MSIVESEQLAIVDCHAANLPFAGPAQVERHAAQDEARFAAAVFRLRRNSSVLIIAHGPALHAATFVAAGALVAVVGIAAPWLPSADVTHGSGVSFLASVRTLPFRGQCFDFVAEFHGAWALTAEREGEASDALTGVRGVLRRGGRYLCGEHETGARFVAGSRLSLDRRRVDEWRQSGNAWQHRLQLARPDGTWARMSERLRRRSPTEARLLLERSGFSLLGAFRGYRQDYRALEGEDAPILLCEAR